MQSDVPDAHFFLEQRNLVWIFGPLGLFVTFRYSQSPVEAASSFPKKQAIIWS